MSARKFEQRVLSVVKRNHLWATDDSVTLAVSGGVDSMVLLDVLIRAQRSHRGALKVVTFDHGFRSESADEVVFVQTVCQSHNIPCLVHALHI